MLEIREVHSIEDLERIKELFIEYASSRDYEICFNGFKHELAALPEYYASPHGKLLLAIEGYNAIGCIALKRVSNEICELRRLYVRPSGRGKGIGRGMVAKAVESAKELGYNKIQLETMPIMKEAISIYRSNGFKQVCHPICCSSDKVLFMELNFEAR